MLCLTLNAGAQKLHVTGFVLQLTPGYYEPMLTTINSKLLYDPYLSQDVNPIEGQLKVDVQAGVEFNDKFILTLGYFMWTGKSESSYDYGILNYMSDTKLPLECFTVNFKFCANLDYRVYMYMSILNAHVVYDRKSILNVQWREYSYDIDGSVAAEGDQILVLLGFSKEFKIANNVYLALCFNYISGTIGPLVVTGGNELYYPKGENFQYTDSLTGEQENVVAEMEGLNFDLGVIYRFKLF